MYFALGLLTAGLVALMVAPAIWRRAARVTRNRIEKSVPLSLAEIQADKDQLRAEFAMSTRRLELSIERLKEKAAEQQVEINRKREHLARLGEEQSLKLASVGELETRESQLRERLRLREESLSKAETEATALEARLSDRSQALRDLEKKHDALRQRADEQTVELVARGTEVDNLRRELTTTETARATAVTERAALDSQLVAVKADLAGERMRAEALEARVTRLEGEKTECAELLERRDREIAELRAEIANAATSRDALESRLGSAESARVEAEAQISRLSLRLEVGDGQAGADVQKVLDAFQEDRSVLAERLAAAEEERDQVAAENAELRRLAGDDWESERMENALFRERLNDIATSVARLTRNFEAQIEEAPIESPAARKLIKAARAAKAAAAEAKAAEVAGESEVGAQAKTLADRIRALQRPVAGE
ncbi:MAG: hypothetical protein U1E56_09895 [Bauldia sp.]